MPFDRELGVTVRKEHILQLVRAWEGDESYGVPLELTAITSSSEPALVVRNRAPNGVGLLVQNSTGNGDLLRVTDAGVAFSFQPGSVNGAGVVTPAISMGGDSDTGMWKPGNLDNNGMIALASQGVEIERWTPTAHTALLPLSLQGMAANQTALTLAPVAATGTTTQQGPRLVLRATSSDVGVPHVLDFIVRPKTAVTTGMLGFLEIYAKLDSGAEALLFSLSTTGALSLGASGAQPILNTIGNNKGDIIAFSDDNAPVVQGAGANGQVLTANSNAASGLSWTTPNANPFPSPHVMTHLPGGVDAMSIDELPEEGSLRTLGTGAQQAAAGNHTHAGVTAKLWSMMLGGM